MTMTTTNMARKWELYVRRTAAVINDRVLVYKPCRRVPHGERPLLVMGNFDKEIDRIYSIPLALKFIQVQKTVETFSVKWHFDNGGFIIFANCFLGTKLNIIIITLTIILIITASLLTLGIFTIEGKKLYMTVSIGADSMGAMGRSPHGQTVLGAMSQVNIK